jgi:hypothetical protein
MNSIVIFIALALNCFSSLDYPFIRSYDIKAVDYVFISAAFDDIEANGYNLADLRYYTLGVSEGEDHYIVGITAGEIEDYDCNELRGRVHHIFYNFENMDPTESMIMHIGYFDQVPWFAENCSSQQD